MDATSRLVPLTRRSSTYLSSSAHSSIGRGRPSIRVGRRCVGRVFSQSDALFCFGLGYTGRGLANQLLKQSWSVSGTCQRAEECSALPSRIAAFVFDPSKGELLSPEALTALRGASHVLSTVPPLEDSGNDPVLLAYGQLLAEEAERLRWVGYLSSTGVYGDQAGGWVTESSSPEPSTPKLMLRRAAEQKWEELALEAGLPLHIFRVAGIYGPGRSALEVVGGPGVARRQQRPSSQRRAQKRYTSRVHVADVCNVVQASMNRPTGSRSKVYNVVDDDPTSRAEVLCYAAALQCVPARVPAPVSALAPDEKRVSNALIKTELGVKLLFPTYREGLSAIHAGDKRPFE